MHRNLDISPEDRAIIAGILRQTLPPDVKVWVFGSRATGKSRKYSDLDLALKGAEEIPLRTLCALGVAFEQSFLPYRVDVVDLKSVAPSFLKLIEPQLSIFEF